MIYLYLAAGGAAGTLARFWMTGWIGTGSGHWFPWGTLAVNVTGSLLLGVAIGWADAVTLSTEMRALITIGLCGAFTTFSTMSYETVMLIQGGAWTRAAAYAIGGLAVGLAAVLAGLVLGRLVAT